MDGVVGVGVKKKVVNQRCMVRFVCPTCFMEVAEDAYDGPVYDETCRVWMEPVAVIRDAPPPQRHTPPPTAYPDPNRGM